MPQSFAPTTRSYSNNKKAFIAPWWKIAFDINWQIFVQSQSQWKLNLIWHLMTSQKCSGGQIGICLQNDKPSPRFCRDNRGAIGKQKKRSKSNYHSSSETQKGPGLRGLRALFNFLTEDQTDMPYWLITGKKNYKALAEVPQSPKFEF